MVSCFTKICIFITKAHNFVFTVELLNEIYNSIHKNVSFDFQQNEHPSICFCINELPSTWLCVNNKSIIELTDFLFEVSDDSSIRPVFTCLGSYWTNGANTFMAVTSLFICAQETLYLTKWVILITTLIWSKWKIMLHRMMCK